MPVHQGFFHCRRRRPERRLHPNDRPMLIATAVVMAGALIYATIHDALLLVLGIGGVLMALAVGTALA